MLFNSYIFIFLFFPLTLIGYFGLSYARKYNAALTFLVGMSLWFYGYNNIYYLVILIVSIILNYGIANRMRCLKAGRMRRFVMLAGVFLNIGILLYFKYYDFFIENINAALKAELPLLKLALPLGISFYTFQQLSYVIDVYRDECESYSFLEYAAYVSYFPQLVAGPIVYHSELIPQFRDPAKRRINFDNLSKGLYAFALGLAKKVLIADTFSKIVTVGYGNISDLNTPSVILVMVCYSLQIYFDFSGYCDMAIGIGKMFNVELPDNFISPYHAASVKEFWRRWHITLGRFFTTYVYIPLGGNRGSKCKTFRNTMIVFLLSGLWHGANWTFVFWGFLHGIGVSFTNFFGGKTCGKWKRKFYQVVTFIYVCFAFVFFRSDSMAQGIEFFKRMFSFTHFRSLYVVAESMTVSETYMITKLLSMKAPQYLPTVNLITLLLVMGISLFIITRKNTRTIVEHSKYSLGFALKLSVVFVWAVLSLSGVTTFLYFNF